MIKKAEAPINEGSVSLNHGMFHILRKYRLQSISEHVEETNLLLEMEEGQEFSPRFSGTASKGKGGGRVYAEFAVMLISLFVLPGFDDSQLVNQIAGH